MTKTESALPKWFGDSIYVSRDHPNKFDAHCVFMRFYIELQALYAKKDYAKIGSKSSIAVTASAEFALIAAGMLDG